MGRPKIYKINDEYFNASISERESYFLGLIMSDGHLDYKRGGFGYICSMKDISIIEFIKNELNSTHPIKTVINNDVLYARYSIMNKKMVQNIINKYSLPYSNKSKNNIIIPNNLPINCVSHFLRGFFDGDGSIWFDGATYRASFTGGEKMMKSIRLVLNDLEIPTYFGYRYSEENKNSCNLVVNGTWNVDKFGDFIYKESFFSLKRKYDKFMECKSRVECSKKRLFRFNGNEEKIKQMYIKGFSQKEIAIQLKLGYSSVKGCVQRLRRKKQII
jgi:hypothetical protein